MSKTILFQALQFSQTVVIQINQFCISKQFGSIYTDNPFYFKQFSLARVHNLIVKTISISNCSDYSNSSISANLA